MRWLGLGFGILAFSALSGAIPADAGRSAMSLPPGRPGLEVDVQLVLAVDVSLSMSDNSQRLQRDGYVHGFRDALVHEAIKSGPNGRVAVTYIEWSGEDEQRVVVDWMLIDSPEAAKRFADRLAAEPIGRVRRTSISSAMLFSAKKIASSIYSGARKVIDFSGDGSNNEGPSITKVHQQIVDQGIVVNGLPLMIDGQSSPSDPVNLEMYYDACVIGGAGSFLIPVRDMDEFRSALKTKLILEIAGLPPALAPRAIPAGNPTVKSAVNCNGEFNF